MTTVAAVAKPAVAPRADVPNDLAAFWLPFTPNRAFKKRPRLISRAKDMHYFTPEGREILDATAGLWCCNAGHNRAPIVAAIQRQAAELDFSPTFQFAHPQAFSSPPASRNWRRATSITCSSAIPARRPPTRRSKSPSPITTCADKARASA